MTAAPRPAARSQWWIAPALVTVLTVPLLAFGALCALFSPMAFDSCGPGDCPQTAHHVVLGVACLPVAVLLLIGSWPAGRAAGPGLRSTLYLLAPGAALLALASFLTAPVGH